MCVTNTAFLRQAQQQRLSLSHQQQQTQSKVASSENEASHFSTASCFNEDNSPVYSVSSVESFSAPQHENTGASSAISYSQNFLPGSFKSRPKRRRPPQKPGKTAKMNDRRFVEHNYNDHLNDDLLESELPTSSLSTSKGKKDVNLNCFTLKLHKILEQVEQRGWAHICSWQPHGRCFVIHDPKAFATLIMPEFFRHSKLTSFQRQLNLYGFNRLTAGADTGGYYHELFLRARPLLGTQIVRTKVKGAKFRAASNPDQEPDLYSWPSASGTVITPPQSPPASPSLMTTGSHSCVSLSSSMMTHPVSLRSTLVQQEPASSTVLFSRADNSPLSMIEPSPFPKDSVLVTQKSSHAHPKDSSFSSNEFSAKSYSPYQPPSFMESNFPQEGWTTGDAVDELFLQGDQPCGNDGLSGGMGDSLDCIDYFVRNCLSPTTPSQEGSQSESDDLALGYLIDRMLEE